MVELDVERFFSRLEKLYGIWTKHRANNRWNDANCLSLNHGAMDPDDLYMKSVIIQQYLFGYELPDTVVLLTEGGHFLFLATKRKCEFVRVAVDQIPKGSTITKVTVMERNKADNNAQNYSTLLSEVESCRDGLEEKEKVKIGIFAKEYSTNTKTKNPVVTGWQDQIDAASETVETVDVTSAMGFVMMVKDPHELDCMKKSSVLSNKVLKHHFVNRLEDIIDKEESVTHEALAEGIEAILADPSKMKLKVSADIVRSAYDPIIQSGGGHDIRLSASSNEKVMKYDIITISFGAVYQNYCSNITRTFLVDPPKEVSDNYEALLAVHDVCLSSMRPGRPLKSVYAAAVEELIKQGRKDLVKKLPKNLGFAIGMDFRDSALTLSAKNNAKFQAGMTFNLAISFANIDLSSKGKDSVPEGSPVKEIENYALAIADTVQITENVPDVLTKHQKNTGDISYTINDENEADDGNGDSSAPNGDAALARKLASEHDDSDNGVRTSKRLASTYDAMADANAGAAERERRQIELMNRRNMERVRELARRSRKGGDGDEAEKAEELQAYAKTRDYPDSVLPNQIKVDMPNKCVLLPIGGNPVPFHISTIKAAVLTTPDSAMDAATLLRINFYTASMSLGKEASVNITKLVQKYAPYATFIRELTFRSIDGHNLTQAYRMILEMRKRFKQKEVQEQEEATLVKQDKLVRTKNERVPRLSDLTMRPVFAGRKTQGNLEAHQNGLRFISNRGETVEIIYSNIKHAIFQPCESEIMVLIHFHLKNPIMIGKKKQRNLQVFTEVIDASQAVDAGRRNMYDPEEMDDEQRERQLRRKLNDAFKEFCRKVEIVARKNGFSLEFDIPYRDLGFQGNPHKEMVYIMPTLNCLVNLTETPFFVVDLNDVDHVHFERVTFASKAFDIVLVNKDFTKPVWKIDMVPNNDKDSIQDWLTDMEISYTEGPMNLNWKSIMSTIAEDDRFYMNTEEDEVTEKEAGWSFLRLYGQDDDSDGQDSAEEDSDFDDRDDESGEESEESEEEFDEEESEESDFDADEELEEQGMDWEDMERQAIMDDKRKSRRGDDMDDGGGGGGGRNGKRKRTASSNGGRRSSQQRGQQRRRR
eukprot:CAMPEP_0203685358 /NCGR_PEP_ID=MMETSP0090-20130426/48505_1 /ASSEMBLY_ACC=CAM_ASM_001088 /TAXON_ID=426623 /ORGANISM="Chaetoceros affinis, Strain CCMP159" /LENGTH=1101 /DNA_ID=CAMNT_0050554549 /DNA_START=99 /DNA_END=3404 /DNA_ORIENTATION=-